MTMLPRQSRFGLGWNKLIPQACATLTDIHSIRPDPTDIAARVERWAVDHGRGFPWRATRSRYRLAVAEILLQKTRAEDVAPVWQRLTTSYPTADRMLVANPADLLSTIAPLGLGSQRLRRLTDACMSIRSGAEMGGLGAYGSAVVSLAIGRRRSTVPVDGNIARIVTRVWGLSWDRGEPRKKPETLHLVDALLGDAAPARQLQLLYALVDFGAKVCTPTNPACGSCPLRASCSTGGRWRRAASTADATAAAKGGGTASETRRI